MITLLEGVTRVEALLKTAYYEQT